MKNKKESNIKTIYKWLRSDKGKRYSFFIFYIFFFVFVFIFLAFTNSSQDEFQDTNNTDTNINNKQEVTSSLPFNTSNLENNNYTFKYQVLKNDKKKEYLGEKQTNLIKILNDTGTYEYKYRNGNLIENIELDEYYQLFDIYTIKRIIKNSKYEYKQEYNDGRIIYSYLIKNGDLANFLEIENYKQDDLHNEIKIETNNKNQVYEITFDIINLINNSSNLDDKDTMYKIIITYGDIDE